MDNRPSWVPGWAWREFERDCAQYRAARSRGNQHNPEPGIEHFKSLLRDKRCACVWAALDARGERGQYALPALVSLLQQCADAIPREARVPASSRRAMGARVKKQALALRKSLDAVRDDDGHLFRVFRDAMRDEAEVAAERAERRMGALGYARTTARRQAYWHGARQALFDVGSVLEVIANAADKWAHTAPVVLHPDSPRAARLYFLREATLVFRAELGTPLRAAVAAMVNTLFPQEPGCELTATDVAKLAP